LAYNAGMDPLKALMLGLFGLPLLFGAAPARESQAPDLILHGATVILVDPPGKTAEAVGIRADRIVFAGSSEEALKLAGPATRVVDLKGRTIIPGLIDAHGHVSSLGFTLTQVDALGTRSAGEVAERVRKSVDLVAPGAWIQGRGWDQNDWADTGFPTHELLDKAAPMNPVAIERVDGHATWVNARAMALAGIDRKTPEPPGGRIVRDANGFPTGVLVDNAVSLVDSKIPAPDRETTKQAILRALNRCLDSGLTGVHDAGISYEEAAIYKELAAQKKLPIRVYAMLGGNSRTLPDYFVDKPLIGYGGGFLTIRTIKLGIDGALGSRGAALDEDYSDDPGNRGLITRSPDEIRSLAVQAAAKGFQVAVHAIGDRGNRLALDALIDAVKRHPGEDLRFRIEHAQILHLEDIPRFKKAGIIPSMQPTHCTSDMPWAEERLGPERIKGAYAWRKILNTGAIIPGGSDFPVESENPFLGIYAAVTRQDLSGRPPGGWRSEEKMTREEALRSFTLWAAYAGFGEGELGSIAAGKKADLVILGANPLAVPVSEIAKMKPEAVLVDGRVVRSAGALGKALAAIPAPGASR